MYQDNFDEEFINISQEEWDKIQFESDDEDAKRLNLMNEKMKKKLADKQSSGKEEDKTEE